jgi:hypothetical protein
MPASMSFHCWFVIAPASFSAQYFQASEPEPEDLARMGARASWGRPA